MARPTVMVKEGWLRGMKINSEVGESFISFKGIPFAEPPVGDLRFKVSSYIYNMKVSSNLVSERR